MGHSVHPVSYRLPLQRGWPLSMPPLLPPWTLPLDRHLERQLSPHFPLILFGSPLLFGTATSSVFHLPFSLPPLSLLLRFLLRLNRLGKHSPFPHLRHLERHSGHLLVLLLATSLPPSFPVSFRPLLVNRFDSLPPSLLGRLLTLRLRRNRASLNRLVRSYLSAPLGLEGLALEGRGRFNRSQRAGRFRHRWGSTPFSSQSSPILYAIHTVCLKYGSCSIRLWLSRAPHS